MNVKEILMIVSTVGRIAQKKTLTRSSSRDINTTLKTLFLVAGSTGAAILKSKRWVRSYSVPL
jgi:hypothetical protein